MGNILQHIFSRNKKVSTLSVFIVVCRLFLISKSGVVEISEEHWESICGGADRLVIFKKALIHESTIELIAAKGPDQEYDKYRIGIPSN